MQAIILAVLAGLCWGIGEVATKSVLLTHKVGPFTAAAVRGVVAAPVLVIAYFVVTRLVTLPRPEPEGWTSAGSGTLAKLVLGSGLCAGAVATLFFYAALNVGEIGRVKPIAFSVAPATGMILGCLLLGETFTLPKAVGLGLVITGVVLLTGR